jgi:putative ABC transport system permease protein
MQSVKLQHGTLILSVNISGVEPMFGDIRNLIPAEGGRFINPIDQEKRRRVAFIGDELAQQVFGIEAPVGQTIRLNGSPFTIIGVMQKKDQSNSYAGQDNGRIFIPGKTLKAMTGYEYVNNIVFMADETKNVGLVKNEVVRVMAAQQRFDPRDTQALGMWDTSEGAKFMETFMLAFKIFLGTVGCLTMIVGGIGVSNIMNVVVEERTREIGIKMALGAKSRLILSQFLVETLVMVIIGGIIGILLTHGICSLFPAFNLTDYVGTPHISPTAAIITASLLGLIGFVSGYFPARTAANLDPVVAMKM